MISCKSLPHFSGAGSDSAGVRDWSALFASVILVHRWQGLSPLKVSTVACTMPLCFE